MKWISVLSDVAEERDMTWTKEYELDGNVKRELHAPSVFRDNLARRTEFPQTWYGPYFLRLKVALDAQHAGYWSF